jgi:hypothetical protein
MLEFLTRRGIADSGEPCLIPTDYLGEEAIQTLAHDAILTTRLTGARNPKHHRLFFAVINVVFKSQNYYATREHMLDDIKIAIGHFEWVESKFGRRQRPKSINFNSMDQSTFNEFYDKAMHFILSEIMPRMKQADLEAEVYRILGGPQPNDVR